MSLLVRVLTLLLLLAYLAWGVAETAANGDRHGPNGPTDHMERPPGTALTIRSTQGPHHEH